MNKAFLIFATVGLLSIGTGCQALQDKAVGAAGGIDAFKVETSGSTSTGTVLPNITLGGAVSAVADSPACEQGKTGAPVFSRARRNSFFGELFGIDATTEAVVYVGSPGETGKETAARLEAIQKALQVPRPNQQEEQKTAVDGK